MRTVGFTDLDGKIIVSALPPQHPGGAGGGGRSSMAKKQQLATKLVSSFRTARLATAGGNGGGGTGKPEATGATKWAAKGVCGFSSEDSPTPLMTTPTTTTTKRCSSKRSTLSSNLSSNLGSNLSSVTLSGRMGNLSGKVSYLGSGSTSYLSSGSSSFLSSSSSSAGSVGSCSGIGTGSPCIVEAAAAAAAAAAPTTRPPRGRRRRSDRPVLDSSSRPPRTLHTGLHCVSSGGGSQQCQHNKMDGISARWAAAGRSRKSYPIRAVEGGFNVVEDGGGCGGVAGERGCSSAPTSPVKNKLQQDDSTDVAPFWGASTARLAFFRR